MIVLERLDDTQVVSVEVGTGKARTAAIFRRPSKVLEDQIREGESPLSLCLGLLHFKAESQLSSMAR